MFAKHFILFFGATASSAPVVPPEEVPTDPTFTEIFSGVSEAKSSVNQWLTVVADKLKANEETKQDGELVDKFNNDWLSLIGWNRGLSGLVKDFAWQYYGQPKFHDNNGPLLSAIREFTTAIAAPVEVEKHERFQMTLQYVTNFGQTLFNEEGSLKDFMADLKEATENKTVMKALMDSDKEVGKLQSALTFLVTDLPSKKKADEQKELSNLDDMDDDDEL